MLRAHMKEATFESLFSLAKHHFNERDPIKSLKHLEEAMNYAEDDDMQQAFEFYGKIYNNMENKEKALEYFEKALERTLNIHEKISLLNKIALLHAGLKDYTSAISTYEECQTLLEETNDLSKEMIILKNLGKLYMRNGNYVESLRCHQRSLALKRLAGDQLGEASNLRYIGQTYENSGNYEIARDYYEKSLEIYEKLDYKDGIDKLNKLLDDLDELEEEFEEEQFAMKDWNLSYDRGDFF